METEQKDPELWKIAQTRATFKYHALIYFIMNIFFWTLWYIQLKNHPQPPGEGMDIPWPIWPMLGWGIGLFFNYLAAYRTTNNLAEKEYEKIKNKL